MWGLQWKGAERRGQSPHGGKGVLFTFFEEGFNVTLVTHHFFLKHQHYHLVTWHVLNSEAQLVTPGNSPFRRRKWMEFCVN